MTDATEMNAGKMAVEEFLDALAAGESTPGGGGAAALTASQAAALLSMVLNFTVGRKKYADVEAELQEILVQTETLRRELVELVNQDAQAFAAVAACYSMPRKSEEEKAARQAAMQAGLQGAAAVPMAVAEKCVTILQLTEPVGAKGNVNVVSDAASAMYLAQAALQCALANVNINLKFIQDEAFVAATSSHRDTLVAAAQAAYGKAQSACETTLEIAL